MKLYENHGFSDDLKVNESYLIFSDSLDIKSMDWLLYGWYLRHERVQGKFGD